MAAVTEKDVEEVFVRGQKDTVEILEDRLRLFLHRFVAEGGGAGSGGGAPGEGTVTSFSFSDGNGFFGNVDFPTSSPVLSLTHGAWAFPANSVAIIGLGAGINNSLFIDGNANPVLNGYDLLAAPVGSFSFNTLGLPVISGVPSLVSLVTNGYVKTSGGNGTLSVTGSIPSSDIAGLGTAASLPVDTDPTLGANSDTRIPSQKAVKTFVSSAVSSLLELQGNISCATNPPYPPGLKGDAYYVSSSGFIGGAAGKKVDIGDLIVCNIDNAGGLEAAVGTSWFVLEHNLTGAGVITDGLDQFAPTTSAELASVITDETGTGFLVFSLGAILTGPFFINASLGTPVDGNLSNCTDYRISNIAGLGTGVVSALGINVGAAGSFVVQNGVLGTPSSGNLVNCTGYPIPPTSVGSVTGLGTGVATALAVNVGTVGSFVVNGGVLGTPTSGSLINCTNYALSAITGFGTGVSGALNKNIGTAGAVVLFGGALGIPSSGDLSNCTGFPSGGFTGGVLTSMLTLRAGTVAAGTAPLKWQSGPLNTVAEAGAAEFLTDKFYGVITTGAARKEFVLADAALTAGKLPFITTNGRMMDAVYWTYEQDSIHNGQTWNVLTLKPTYVGTTNYNTALNICAATGGSGTNKSVSISLGDGTGTSNSSTEFLLQYISAAASGTAGGYSNVPVSSALIYSNSCNIVINSGFSSKKIIFLMGLGNAPNQSAMDSAGLWGFGHIAPLRRIHVLGTTVTEAVRTETNAAGNVGSIEMFSAGTGGLIAGTVGLNASAGPTVFAIAGTENLRLTATRHTATFNNNGDGSIFVNNISTGSLAYGSMIVGNSANQVVLFKLSTGWTASGLMVADQAVLRNGTGSMLISNLAAADIIFSYGGSAVANEVFRIGATRCQMSVSAAADVGLAARNLSNAATAYGAIYAQNDTGSFFALLKSSSGATASGVAGPNIGRLYNSIGNIVIGSAAANDVIFVTSDTTEIARFTSAANFSMNGIAGQRFCVGGPQATEVLRVGSSAAGTSGFVDIFVSGTGGFQAGCGGISLTGPFVFAISAVEICRFSAAGKMGLGPGGGVPSPTAYLHLKAGAAAAGSGPFKLTSGVNLTTPEAGTLEYNGTNLFFTRVAGARESVLTGVIGATPANQTVSGVQIASFWGVLQGTGPTYVDFLANPNAWATVVINGQSYYSPLYT